MNRTVGLAVFIGIALAILFGIHYYLWARLVRDPQWPRPWGTVLTVVLVMAALGVPVNLVLGRAAPRALPWFPFLRWPASVWLGTMFLLFICLLGADVLRLGGWLVGKAGGGPGVDAGTDLARRRLFARWGAVGAALLGAGASVGALRSALGPVRVKRVEVRLPRLAAEHDGLTLVQLTDLHVGPTIGRPQIEDLVRRTNALDPDLVVITGDLVDGSVGELWESVAPLAQLSSKLGVFFVTGNHEYYSGAAEWVRALPRLGLRVLRNERVSIARGTPAIELAGVDDRSAARSGTPGHGEDLDKALAGWPGREAREARPPLVLLAHQPRTVIDSARFAVDLQLSGHTHGGQIWPFGALVELQQRFLSGLGRHRDTWIYVSRGTGYWGPPMRLGAPAEITQIVLRADRAQVDADAGAGPHPAPA
jgi:predicted MPP superfamily phosphohydrolase